MLCSCRRGARSTPKHPDPWQVRPNKPVPSSDRDDYYEPISSPVHQTSGARALWDIFPLSSQKTRYGRVKTEENPGITRWWHISRLKRPRYFIELIFLVPPLSRSLVSFCKCCQALDRAGGSPQELPVPLIRPRFPVFDRRLLRPAHSAHPGFSFLSYTRPRGEVDIQWSWGACRVLDSRVGFRWGGTWRLSLCSCGHHDLVGGLELRSQRSLFRKASRLAKKTWCSKIYGNGWWNVLGYHLQNFNWHT